jgi:hypothetical protein
MSHGISFVFLLSSTPKEEALIFYADSEIEDPELVSGKGSE